MARTRFVRDSAGVEAFLKSAPVAAAVGGLANRAAAAARAHKPQADIVVDRYTTDRAAASVTIRDVRGRLWQVRDGVLTRAAAAAGLEVTSR